MVNPTGYTALDMIGFTDRGPYSSSANYVKNDLVHDSGNIWRCLIDDTSGIAPAEGVNWTLFIGEPTNLVERIIAPVETDPATNAWAVGRQIIYNDNLYEVITAITAGDALVAYEDDPTNANIKLADPVETQLLDLKGNLSNRNLLDNAWFTINQRGFTSGNTNGYTVDRWRLNAVCTVTVNSDNSITLSKAVGEVPQFVQFIDPTLSEKLDGKTVTLSALIGNTIYKGTFVYENEDNFIYQIPINNEWVLDYRCLNNSATGHMVRFLTSGTTLASDITIKAVKLELGSISTLAMDTAPSYAEELLKCQRYFVRLGGVGSGYPLALGRAHNTTQGRYLIKLPVEMRTTAVVTCSNFTAVRELCNHALLTPTAFSAGQIEKGGWLQLYTTTSGLVTDEVCALIHNATYFDVSADL